MSQIFETQPASPEDLIYQHKRWKEMLKRSHRKPKPIDKPELENDCLIWDGPKNHGGYGISSYRDKPRKCHVISWIIHNQVVDVPYKPHGNRKLPIRHMCNQRSCMESTHVRIGTDLQNGEDKIKSGSAQGINAKITRELAEKIKWSKRKRNESGYRTQKQRATDLGVSLSIIHDIDNGCSWTHIPQKDGTIDRSKLNQRLEKERKQRKKAKEKIWTEAQWKAAEDKLWNNKDYTRRHPTRSHNGVYCLEWIRGKTNGYPQINIHGQKFLGHRLACIIGNNYTDCPGLDAAHECGFSLCVERIHVRFKTVPQNAKDKHKHGTMPTKLTTDQVIAIRKQYKKGGITQKMLGQKYNVSQNTISEIIRRKIWTHI